MSYSLRQRKRKSRIVKRISKTNKRKQNKKTRKFKKSTRQYGGYLEEEKKQQFITIFQNIGFTENEISKLMNKLIQYSSHYNNPTKQTPYERFIIQLETIQEDDMPNEYKKKYINDLINRRIKIWEEKEPDTDNEFDEPEYDEHLLYTFEHL